MAGEKWSPLGFGLKIDFIFSSDGLAGEPS